MRGSPHCGAEMGALWAQGSCLLFQFLSTRWRAPKAGMGGRGLSLEQEWIRFDLVHFHFLVESPYFFLFQNSKSRFPLIQAAVLLTASWGCPIHFFLLVLEVFIFLILFLRSSIPFSLPLFIAFLPGRTALPSVTGVLVSLSICDPQPHAYPPQLTYTQNYHLALRLPVS